jgi:soluble lytic murein transglycosylase
VAQYRNPVDLPAELRKNLDESFIEWLIATQEYDVARDYLDETAQRIRKNKNGSVEIWTGLLHLYARSNQYLSLFAQLNSLDSSTKKTLIDNHADLIFPRPYYETVTQAATRFGVSMEFIYSIMRQESSFNPQARSPMDAFGLMQLLPQVAKKSATANSIDYSNPEDLYEPHINIPIGSAHLRELWDKYNGEIILAVASYNASEKAIVNWLQTRYRGDTLEFVEDIPYDETRDYVKLVLRNLITYQLMSSVEPQNFPDWTLKISYRTEK